MKQPSYFQNKRQNVHYFQLAINLKSIICLYQQTLSNINQFIRLYAQISRNITKWTPLCVQSTDLITALFNLHRSIVEDNRFQLAVIGSEPVCEQAVSACNYSLVYMCTYMHVCTGSVYTNISTYKCVYLCSWVL